MLTPNQHFQVASPRHVRALHLRADQVGRALLTSNKDSLNTKQKKGPLNYLAKQCNRSAKHTWVLFRASDASLVTLPESDDDKTLDTCRMPFQDIRQTPPLSTTDSTRHDSIIRRVRAWSPLREPELAAPTFPDAPSREALTPQGLP